MAQTSKNYGIINGTNNILDSKASGPLASLYNTVYRFSNRFYPRNLDTDQRGHYIIFYINAAQNSKFISSKYLNEQVNGPGGRTAANADPETLSVKYNENVVTDLSGLQLFNRKTKRIREAIALYMPDTMNVQYGANWQDTSLTSAFGTKGALAQNFNSVAENLANYISTPNANFLSTVIGNLSAPAAEATGAFANQFFGNNEAGDFVMFAGGFAVNPQLEVLFKGVGLRTFQFDFIFSPYDRTEAEAVKEIIHSFKFHAAPEVLEKQGTGRYFVPPSEFDIDFMYKGQKNNKIHQIGTCVLTNINVDYAPNGWATFGGNPDSGLAGYGAPVQTRMTLQFQETEIVTKDRVNEGY